jgi:hypothetical protein
MKVQTDITDTSVTVSSTSEISRLSAEGIIAGMIGAAIIAIWFLILDTIEGRPLYTPTVLGTVLFGRGEWLSPPERIGVSLEMALMYTWVHALVFAVIGGIASYLLGLIEKNADLGFGIFLLFVVMEFGFIVAAFIFAEPILHALAWPAVLIGNLLATAGMAGYFWLRHPNLMIRP